MKKLNLIIALTFFVKISFAQVSINTTGANPHASSMLDVASTDKGMLIPRMDSVQRKAIVSPAQGLMVFQTRGDVGYYFYAGTTWHKVGDAGDNWHLNTNNDIYTGKNVGVGNSNPTEKLDVMGNIKTTGEIKPNGNGGLASQVLTATGTGSMVWANATSATSQGNGGWGDCSIYNIDSYQPVTKPDGKPQDFFGGAVAISGEYAIVGSSGDDYNGITDCGSVTIFKFNSATEVWESQGKLVDTNPQPGDRFGFSVAISGDYAIVGAITDDEGGFTDNGSATIFKRNSGNGLWENQGKVLNTTSATNDWFGYSVSISGEYAIVGAYLDDEGGFNDCGSAVIFKRNAGTGVWESQGAKLLNPSIGNYNQFGYSVSISGDYAFVGAPGDQSVGSATIFKRNSGTGIWASEIKLSNIFLNTDALFGNSVSISGDYAIVGVKNYDTYTLADIGLAYIYKHIPNSSVWEQQEAVINPQYAAEDWFGSAVAINDNYAMISARGDDDGNAVDAGSVTIFKKNNNSWLPHQKFTFPNVTTNAGFGNSLAMDPITGRFIIGAVGANNEKGLTFFGKVKN